MIFFFLCIQFIPLMTIFKVTATKQVFPYRLQSLGRTLESCCARLTHFEMSPRDFAIRTKTLHLPTGMEMNCTSLF